MKRNLDLIRDLLLLAEDSDGPVSDDELSASDYPRNEVAYHVELMTQRGLIDGYVEYDGFHRTALDISISSTTWDGCDCLDAIRSDDVWHKAKAAVRKSVGEASLSVMKEVCSGSSPHARGAHSCPITTPFSSRHLALLALSPHQ